MAEALIVGIVSVLLWSMVRDVRAETRRGRERREAMAEKARRLKQSEPH